MVSNYKVGYGRERARQGDSYPVERDRSEKVKAMRSGLKWVACILPGVLVMSRPGSQLLPMSVTLLQLTSVTPKPPKAKRIRMHRVGRTPH